ncbi:S-inosyl-L-homocysteine hydrolase [Geodia barretti]|uniref:Adenosylhomocysteinase n=1 Tax=Geodia barretti TaxID=519541 RepID=A0AA35RRK1_GEOBA|nr:S-inosyl-L-homocysteine hydrolase [Geodia barretti]
MPVLQHLRGLHRQSMPLAGMRIAGCMHVTKETAILIRALRDAGAEVAWSGCNPLSTQDDVAAALAAEGTPIYAWHGLSTDEFYWCIDQTLTMDPNLTLDDGADLIFRAHGGGDGMTAGIIGGTEETTTGVHRLRAMADDRALKYPVIAVNDATTKWDFDNVYGTGQSALDGVLRATSVLLAGKQLVVAGYGHCGCGVAQRARGLGANVLVTEVYPIAALKATLEGFNVSTMDAASAVGDIFITTTGIRDDGAIVCNAGHYDCEINLDDLSELAVSSEEVRANNREHVLRDGRRLYVLAEGRLVNLAAAEGHPPEVMDMSFANQFLSLIRLAREGSSMTPGVYPVSDEQDREIAAIKLQTMGIEIDELTAEQQAYRTDYAQGT